MTVRVFPPSNPNRSPHVINGRTYTCPTGSYLDVPDDDAYALNANGWILAAGRPGQVGTNAQRPTSYVGDGTKPAPGTTFLDTTLGFIIVYDGLVWRNPSSGAAV